MSSPSLPRKLPAADCSRKPKYMFSFSAANYSLKLHKKYSIKARHYIIRYLSARELVLPPLIQDDFEVAELAFRAAIL